MGNRYVIIGGGPAGVAAAGQLTTSDPSGKVVVVGEESLPFYSRIRLPEFVGGKIDRDALVIRDAGWFADKGIDLRLGKRVTSIDPAGKQLTLDDGDGMAFDAALLATGARSFVPPFPGKDLDGVIAIRTEADAAALRDRASKAKRVVAVGGGLLGLEMAAALAEGGIEVVVIEMFPWLLPRQLDPVGGDVLRSSLEARGLSFRLDAKVAGVDGDGQVSGLRLESGESFETGTVVVSAGVRPDVTLAREAGLDIDRGIVVDEHMATSAEGVYAAGDCAQFKGAVPGIWPVADGQGKTAALAMAGVPEPYVPVAPSHTLKVTGIDVFSAGDIDAEGKLPSEVETRPGVYRKIVKDPSGRTVGAVFVGDVNGRGAIQKAIQASQAT